jgi:hypothetical protein
MIRIFFFKPGKQSKDKPLHARLQILPKWQKVLCEKDDEARLMRAACRIGCDGIDKLIDHRKKEKKTHCAYLYRHGGMLHQWEQSV